MKSWRVKEVGGAVAVLRSNQKRNRDSSSASSSRKGRFQSLSPVPALRKARVFASCLNVSVVKQVARKAADSKPLGPHGEAQVVSAEVMRLILVDFISKWNAERPPLGNTGNQYQSDYKKNLTMTAVEWLQQETDIGLRKIGGYSRGEFKFVSISHAEKLLIAMGLQYKLSSGEIEIEKNPYWSWHQYNRWFKTRVVDPDVL